MNFSLHRKGDLSVSVKTSPETAKSSNPAFSLAEVLK
ncbi:hypothetical protein D1BOALGB6SA_7055 [Olavius sp. associated proteobacterium Delta 1]|nr:hypothetical protein D1BOALGB6SA_7055 [Olavius sp. associated proteobacterium Delta 1]